MAIHKIDPTKPSDPDGPTAVVVLKCPTCKKRTPHKSKGVKRNPALGDQLTQAMECAVCKTVTDVPTGEDGRDFQSNVDAPDGM